MSDLHETCANVGLDSRKYQPIAHAMPGAGRVAVYIGAQYAYLTLGQALNLRDQLARAIGDLRQQQADRADALAGSQPPAPFGEQLEQFQRHGLAAQSAVARELAEARALAEINREKQP